MSTQQASNAITWPSPSPPPLGRGKACMNCRRRKIKCDGLHPICGQCSRSRNTFGDCEYEINGVRTQTQMLKEQVASLEMRIRELEGSGGSSSSVGLSSPYPEEGSPRWSEVPLRPSTSPISSSPHSNELTIEHQQALFDQFHPSSTHLGFFLHMARFQASFGARSAIGHTYRPTVALMNAIFLWGTYLGQSSRDLYEERNFLGHALSALASDPSGTHPQRILHTIQAEILVSYYLFTVGRSLEGSVHASTALSMALTSQLHLIRSENAHSSSAQASDLILPPSADAVEEGQRIDALWAAVALNNYRAAFTGPQPTSFSAPYAGLDTPWPLDEYEYQTNHLPMENRDTLKRFLEGNVDGFSVSALHVKATVLLERATAIAASMRLDDLSTAADAFSSLDTLVEAFKSSLPLLDGMYATPAVQQMLAVTQLLAHASTIKLHHPLRPQFPRSREQCLVAAQSIGHVTSLIGSQLQELVNPILGVVWASACEILIEEIGVSRGTRPSQPPHNLVLYLDSILARMAFVAQNSPLMGSFLVRIQSMRATLA